MEQAICTRVGKPSGQRIGAVSCTPHPEVDTASTRTRLLGETPDGGVPTIIFHSAGSSSGCERRTLISPIVGGVLRRVQGVNCSPRSCQNTRRLDARLHTTIANAACRTPPYPTAGAGALDAVSADPAPCLCREPRAKVGEADDAGKRKRPTGSNQPAGRPQTPGVAPWPLPRPRAISPRPPPGGVPQGFPKMNEGPHVSG